MSSKCNKKSPKYNNPDYVCNEKTKRWNKKKEVSKLGTCNNKSPKQNDPKYICNEATKRWVLRPEFKSKYLKKSKSPPKSKSPIKSKSKSPIKSKSPPKSKSPSLPIIIGKSLQMKNVLTFKLYVKKGNAQDDIDAHILNTFGPGFNKMIDIDKNNKQYIRYEISSIPKDYMKKISELKTKLKSIATIHKPTIVKI